MKKRRNFFRKSRILAVMEEVKDVFISSKDIYILLNEKFKRTGVKSPSSLAQILRSFNEVEKKKCYSAESGGEVLYYKLKD